MTPGMGKPERPLRAAVVGAGPSGFYAAEALLSSDVHVEVDLYERLPAPFGLVRYGVAPDHAKIKSVIKTYERTARRPGFAFFGNVAVGEDVAVEELRGFYDGIVFTSGAQTDRHLGIPGEDMRGSYTATEFVAWYNAHPDFRERTFDLSGEVAVVIGQGNVAVDVARILAKTVDELKHTDIARHALEALAESNVREVHMIGRRGPAQAAFTPSEIKEFGDLAECDPIVDPADLALDETSMKFLEKRSQSRKNFATLQGFANRAPGTKRKRFVVQFLRSPKALLGTDAVERVLLEKNRLEGEVGRQKAVGTGETTEMECSAFFRSVGYRGVPIPGVPFDERAGVLPNEEGRIVRDGRVIPGLYAAGWIKRGPSGVIGTNKPDSIETVKALLSDIERLPACVEPSREAALDMLRGKGLRVVTYSDWQRIDAAEIARGKAVGKPREKFVRVEEMLQVIGH